MSMGDVIADGINIETIEGIDSRGNKTVTKRKSPLVSTVAVLCATTILLTYIDGGKGMFSKAFGSTCLICSKKIDVIA